jgi:hypothetical protein
MLGQPLLVLTSDASQFNALTFFKLLNLNDIQFIIVTFTALTPILSTKYNVQSTTESGNYKVRRTNNGRLIPNFVLRHSSKT